MALHNRDIALQAEMALGGNRGLAMGATLLWWLTGWAGSITAGLTAGLFLGFTTRASCIAYLLALIIGGPLRAGLALFYLKLSRNNNPEIQDVFSGFTNFLNAAAAYLLYLLFIFLWGLLLIVPGIIAFLTYSQVFFIVADNPHMSGPQALRRSRAIMTGFRWKLFCLICRYLGWILLGFATFCIGFLWILPMIFTAMARFHDDVRVDYEAKAAIPQVS